MLINIFGIWMIISNITFLNPISENTCIVNFTGNGFKQINSPCDQVAQMINVDLKTREHRE